MQGLSLRQTRADEQTQGPQTLRLRGTPPCRWIPFKLYFELALKLFAKVRVVLSRTQ
jgi:hypothetical protein